jgi:hypothetical protein
VLTTHKGLDLIISTKTNKWNKEKKKVLGPAGVNPADEFQEGNPLWRSIHPRKEAQSRPGLVMKK